MQRKMTSGRVAAVWLACGVTAVAQDGSWLRWRGPLQTGVSLEVGLPDSVEPGGETHLWSYPLSGRGTPVIHAGRLYAMAYGGEGADLQEHLLCLDAATGERLWEERFNDFLSDVIYNRYAIGSPGIDPETGNVYCMSAAGILSAFRPDGQLLWRHSMLAEFGRITFPNGRVGTVVIDENRAILHVISAHWGPTEGPARDRFYAFDKFSGQSLWNCTPGETPNDSSFSCPVFEWRNGRRLMYAGTGCGNMVCIDSRTGDAVWRFNMATGGVNASALLYGDHLIAVHGKENLDSSVIGRMVSIRLGREPAAGQAGPLVLGQEAEEWRADLVSFTSSPVLVGNRVYLTTATGDLSCVNADTGEILWHHKLAPDQIHASPLYADGKLYVPMNNGSMHIIRPRDEGPEVLQSVHLQGNCLGAPAVADGRLYVHTTDQLYCFGRGDRRAGVATRLQIVPHDVLLVQGQRVPIRGRLLDAKGNAVLEPVKDLQLVPGPLGLRITSDGMLEVAPDSALAAAVVIGKSGEFSDPMRVRVVSSLPYQENFESIALQPRPEASGGPFAFPPSHWVGARAKFEVVERDGGKVLAKTLDNPLFQRATVMLGSPEMANYTMQVDILSDGNRRTLSSAGLIHQRYLIELKGNHQELEITSNDERIKVSVPYRWKAEEWYTLKSRVDVSEDGSGIVRAKVWPRAEAEPDAWTIEYSHRSAHRQGSPGLLGFAPQSRFRVYLDNLVVTPNETSTDG